MKTFLSRILLFCTVLLPALTNAQSYSDLYTFSLYSGFPPTNTDGALPYCAPVVSGDMIYGTTWEGGTNGIGVIFSVNVSTLEFRDLHAFSALSGGFVGNNYDGAEPFDTLVLSSNVLYGTANQGGSNAAGSVFRINTDGTHFTNLYDFGSYSGAPHAGLIISNDVLYGTTTTGGYDYGSVFRINTDGTHFTNLISFYPSTTNQAFSPYGGLLLTNGKLYGTCGGSSGAGSIFSMNADGSGYTNLAYFQTVKGENQNSTNTTGGTPYGSLVLLGDMLYGTTPHGGTNGNGVIFAINTNGTGFTNLHTFAMTTNAESGAQANSDGANPECALLPIGNTLYGVAPVGGPDGNGSLFSINADGSHFSVLWAFPVIFNTNYLNIDGSSPTGGLALSGTTLYGTSLDGGIDGNVFAFNLTPSNTNTAPNLSFQVVSTNLVLTWDTNDYTLQYTPMLGGSVFTNLLDASSPYTIYPTSIAAFYRLKHD
jgi:uncharacterized repeat protein (TIGR03803 family)